MTTVVAQARETRPLDAKVWQRDALDWYVEEPRASEGLFSVERFVGHIWDPACGAGNIVRAAQAAGYVARGTDIENRCPPHSHAWWSREADFLKWDKQPLAQNIVCNPPFFRGAGTEAFVRKSLSLAKGKIAIFASLPFLAGAKRAATLWTDPPARVWIVTPRVSCPPGGVIAAGGKAAGGKEDWCWLVWDNTVGHRQTDLGWITRS